jgi:hypothetical protein
MDNSIHHLGSFEADLEVGWVHFIILFSVDLGSPEVHTGGDLRCIGARDGVLLPGHTRDAH